METFRAQVGGPLVLINLTITVLYSSVPVLFINMNNYTWNLSKE